MLVFQGMNMQGNANIENNNFKTIFLVVLFLAGTMGASLLEGLPDMMAEDLDDDSPFLGENAQHPAALEMIQ